MAMLGDKFLNLIQSYRVCVLETQIQCTCMYYITIIKKMVAGGRNIIFVPLDTNSCNSVIKIHIHVNV